MKRYQGTIILIFGILIIIRNYLWISQEGYKSGLFFYALNIIGIIAIIYGLYFIITILPKKK